LSPVYASAAAPLPLRIFAAACLSRPTAGAFIIFVLCVFFAIFFCFVRASARAFFVIVLKINDCPAVSAKAQLMKRGFFYFF
jgi:hypothetical protein